MLDDLLYFVLMAPILVYLLTLLRRAIRAKLRADAGIPYSPPPQMWIENGEWKTAPGSQRLAWWRTFMREL